MERFVVVKRSVFSLVVVVFCALAYGSYATAPLRAGDRLDGKHVVVRLYLFPDSPSSYFESRVKIENNALRLTDSYSPSTIVVLTPWDQSDNEVKHVLWNRVFCWNAEHELKRTSDQEPAFSFPIDGHRIVAIAREGVLLDSTGAPIPNNVIQIELALRTQRNIEDPRVLLRVPQPNQSETLFTPTVVGDIGWDFVRFHCEGYGSAFSLSLYTENSTNLVAHGSEAWLSSARGVVQDQEGKPIVGASIQGRSVVLPNGDRLSGEVRVLTNERGEFAFTLARGYEKTLTEGFLPSGSEYEFIVVPPARSGLLPRFARVSNKEYASIVLERPAREHRIVFLSPEGRTYQPDEVKRISASIHMKPGGVVPIDLSVLENGGGIACGSLHARLEDPGLEFQPIDVTPESVYLLTMHAKAKRVLIAKGLVVNGVTNEPIPNAIVMVGRNMGWGNIAEISSEQWADLAKYVPAEPKCDEVRNALMHYSFTNITRANIQGYFEIDIEDQDHLTAIAGEDFTERYRVFRKPPLPATGEVSISPLKLFPAARLRFAKNEDSERTLQYPLFEIDSDSCPEWAREMLPTPFPPPFFSTHRDTDETKLGNIRMGPNPCTISVPAGVSVRIGISPMHGRAFAPGEAVQLKQGEFIDLGEFR